MFGLYWEFIIGDDGFELKDGDWLTWGLALHVEDENFLRLRKVIERSMSLSSWLETFSLNDVKEVFQLKVLAIHA